MSTRATSNNRHLTFGIKGGFEARVRFHDALKLSRRLVNIGDAESLTAHPASTTHRQPTDAELASADVTPDTIPLCIGIEHIGDILADHDREKHHRYVIRVHFFSFTTADAQTMETLQSAC